MTEEERLAFIRWTAETHNLSHQDLSKFSGYSTNSVSGWLTMRDSPRHRGVPARAVDRLLLELHCGRVKGSK
jgi:hypothetical protein